MSEDRPPPPPLPRVKGRLPFPAPGEGRGGLRQSSLVIYALLTATMVGVALYMALIEQRPLTSPWVAAPAIGSLWFALRLFMIWGSRG